MSVELYKNEYGEIAVLVSRGYGAGWSTWNCYPESAWDKRVVELFIQLTEKERTALSNNNQKMDWAKKQMEEWGYSNIYWGGFDDCEIKWVPENTFFRITEYDGCESIEFLNLNTDDWHIFTA